MVLPDIAKNGNEDTAHMFEELGGRALTVKCDVSRNEHIKAALDRTVQTYGRLGAAFDNTGSEQPITQVSDLTEDELCSDEAGCTTGHAMVVDGGQTAGF